MNKLNELTTLGVRIIVEITYQPEYSNPINFEFMFAYRVTIQNNNVYTL